MLAMLLAVAVVPRKVEQMHAMVVVLLFSALVHAVLAELFQLFRESVRLVTKDFSGYGRKFLRNIFE